MRWFPFLKVPPRFKTCFIGGWQWNLFVHWTLQIHRIIMHMLLDSFGLMKYLVLSYIALFFILIVEQLWINVVVFSLLKKPHYSLDWLVCDHLFKFIPFFFFFNKVGLQDAMKNVYRSHFVLMYLWFLKFAPGTAELQLGFLAAF